ncbi:ribonuclease H family protein [Clostridium hydrogenum]|uniref:ribonuclease H family protein n=1 Tax=Clostridium hydrogenum TaxID=2855764 RepID=UPI001F377A8F|nr:ribonuclease H family protein [Clostridium hydrogenum]
MGKKVYAIKEGFDFQNNTKIKDKIVNTWAECLKYVKGVKGAQYKSFESRDSAEAYLSEGSKMLKKSEENYPKDCLHIYVDGSYNVESEKYAYGFVAVKNNVVEYIESNSGKDKSEKNIRQIAGELEAAVKATQYALENGEKRVVIFHDYEGISHHATGFWERREESSINYYNKMNELMKKGIEVIFVKVDSHTGDFFNELVDEKCKEKVKLASDKVVARWLSVNKLKVLNESVKEEILKVAPTSGENIEVVSTNSSKEVNKIASSKYADIINTYKTNSAEAINLVEGLSIDEKDEFIIYLLGYGLNKC